ncbi:homeobox protein prospero [Caerostris darwini]|uniref:Homeobox protein prospero n=1 Tax=Caerostris darwini TaxID=1538125 RepID=A0AAV4TBH6_9ARAC|nr:homeobox protein prospero [Caerostris darwini]
MSSEGEGEAEELKAKTRRVRQRVDAGEPRNSYASIPNFSSRPPGSFGNGFAATRMLCDLIGSGLRGLPPPANGEMFERSPERCSSGGSSSSHLLRDILQQGRNGGGGAADGHGPASPQMDRADEEQQQQDRRMSTASPQRSASCSPCWPATDDDQQADPLQLKRARVETIVSNMLPAPLRANGGAHPPPAPVNGCKKRKLYQPQQHERTSVDGAGAEVEDDEDETLDPSTSPLLKRRNGGAGLLSIRQQLRHMQQQLVVMQHKYMEMVDGGDSTDEEQTKSRDSCEDIKPLQNFADDDNASMYDDARRLVIDDRKDTIKPQQHEGGNPRESCIVQPPNVDYEWLADSLKAELSTSLSQVVDAVLSRCVQQRKGKMAAVPRPEESTPKDPTLLSQMLDRKSPRTTGKVIDRGTRLNGLRTSSPYPPPTELPKPPPPFFFPLKPPSSVAATAAFIYGSPPRPRYGSPTPEQTEAMSLVVASKKKRHKVTDTRLQQRDVSPKYPEHLPPLYHPPPPPLVPVSLPTTVAIPNPSLNQSELFHPGFGGYDPHRAHHFAPLDGGHDDEAPMHPLLPFHHTRGSPDSLQLSSHMKQDSGDLSDTGDSQANYDNNMAMISFLPSSMHTSTLTPMHLRKAKLMFFFARYPSSAVLKMYFPDIRFNKNNTAQLVKWFSNFRISHPTSYPQRGNWRRLRVRIASHFRSPHNGVMSSLLCAHAGPQRQRRAAEKNGRSRKRPTLMRSGPGRMPFLFQLLNRDVFSLARAH